MDEQSPVSRCLAYLVSSKALSCNFDLIKKSFFLWGILCDLWKGWKTSIVDVVIELFKPKRMSTVIWSRCLPNQSQSA